MKMAASYSLMWCWPQVENPLPVSALARSLLVHYALNASRSALKKGVRCAIDRKTPTFTAILIFEKLALKLQRRCYSPLR